MNRISMRAGVLGICLVCTLVVVVQLVPVHALPPRPTPPEPSAPQDQPGADGAQIQLRARFPSAWPWDTFHWQNLWTVVQWQDERRAWHDVAGWQGTLDEVVSEQGVVGIKAWWVADQDLGKGPFRWVITRGEGGRWLGVSEPFYLPNAGHTTTTVDVSLAP